MKYRFSILLIFLQVLVTVPSHAINWPQVIQQIVINNPERKALEALEGCWTFEVHGVKVRGFVLCKCAMGSKVFYLEGGEKVLFVIDKPNCNNGCGTNICTADSNATYLLEDGSYEMYRYYEKYNFVFTGPDEVKGCAYLNIYLEPGPCYEFTGTRHN